MDGECSKLGERRVFETWWKESVRRAFETWWKECDVRFLRSVTKLRGKSDSRIESTFAVRLLPLLTGTRLQNSESVSQCYTLCMLTVWKKCQTQCELCFHSLW